jgi:dTMP kinase
MNMHWFGGMSITNGYPGKLITFEGIDGSGKTTIMNQLKEILGNNGIIYTKEPYQFAGGALELKYPYQRLFRFMEDHVLHLEEVILPALREGKLVICDRYIDSNLAYRCVDMGNARNKYDAIIEWLEVLHSFSTWPCRTILFEISPKLAIERCANKGEELAFVQAERLVDSYNNIANYYNLRFCRINAAKDVESVTGKVLEIVQDVMYKMARSVEKNEEI